MVTATKLFPFFGLVLVLIPSVAHGQRGGGRVGGVGAMHGTGVGGIGPSRRTMVVAAASRGVIGDGAVAERAAARRGYAGGNVAHPGLAAAAVARRVPIGTVIEVLPPDCSMTFISEMEYYYCSGQYYQPMGSEDNQIYVAAEPYVPEY